MPRPNPSRTMGREDLLAQRLEELRLGHRPPLTYEALAKRMADVGCPIQPTALQRIERATPRRRVNVDELVAFAQVFDVALEDLVGFPTRGLKEDAGAALRLYRWAVTVRDEADRRLHARQVEAREARESLTLRHRALLRALAALERVDVDPTIRQNYTQGQLVELVLLREEIRTELGTAGQDESVVEAVEHRG